MFQHRQNTVLFGAILVVVLVLLVVFFFLPGAQTPRVHLADPVPGGGAGQDLTGGPAIGVEITPENVQAVIATLQRAEIYSRLVVQTHYWDRGEASSDRTAEIWHTPEVLRIRWENGENMIITPEAYFLWFGAGRLITRPITPGLGENLDRVLDQFQGIPSYETVLELDPEQIIRAGYTQRTIDGESRYAIYVAVETAVLGYLSYYYICLTTGLLIETVTFDGDAPVYRLVTIQLTLEPPGPDTFLLPDGTDPLNP